MRCKACDNPLPFGSTWNDDDGAGMYEFAILCPHCERKRMEAEEMHQHELDGMWSDKHWVELGGQPLALPLDVIFERYGG